VVFVEISELVEITEGATNKALFGAEDLLQSLNDRNLCDWVGVEEADSAPEAGGVSATEEKEADGALEPRGVANAEGSGTTEHDFFCFAYGAADGAPGPEGDAGPPAAKTVGIQGAPRLETPRWTKTKAVAGDAIHGRCVHHSGGRS
jgi:hypothetical protein